MSYARKGHWVGGAHLDLHICGLPLRASEGLMDHDAGIGERVPLPLFPCRQQEGTHGRCKAHTHRGHIWPDMPHRVEDCHACTATTLRFSTAQ